MELERAAKEIAEVDLHEIILSGDRRVAVGVEGPPVQAHGVGGQMGT